uniref:Mediator of RNA polymerase II transcription subunit 1.1-like n=1 Tax=Nicotiana tabacum TaxID=4097 RepID=A0A1S3Y5T7_TOBAC|nr:PREDICTED: mediator of RNA polymerase II transcription subunit 1.1-like [Nicotiana tabacum]
MTNPQDNPETPPPPTPSNSSTPPPPSTSPKPRLRRVKMLARKTVASGVLNKKLNEKLKVISSVSKNLETRFVLVGSVMDVEFPGSRRSGERVEESGKKSEGSGFGEAAEGLVNLSTQKDEPSSSTKETLADLLKKVGASYDPKKCRTPTTKTPSVPEPSTKRKASPLSITEFPLQKGRAIRNRVRQSESDLQKALDESKKKRLTKGKGKVTESSEEVDVEEMEQAFEPSLAKRTRSTVKGKQVRISKDEEWSGEEVEDSDGEKDKLSMFGKRKILKGRLLKDLV